VYDLSGLRYLLGAVNLLHVDEVLALTAIARELQPVAIVVDTFSRSIAGGDENSSKDVGWVVAQLDSLRVATQATVIVVHHGTKADGSLRGHTALEGAADTIIEAKGAEGRLMLTVTKQKDAAPCAPIRLYLTPVGDSAVLTDRPGAGFAEEGVTEQGRVVLEALTSGAMSDGLSTSNWLEMAVDLGVSRSAFFKHRKSLESTGLVHNIGSAARPRYVPTTSEDTISHEEF
jgi:hypothetical protein